MLPFHDPAKGLHHFQSLLLTKFDHPLTNTLILIGVFIVSLFGNCPIDSFPLYHWVNIFFQAAGEKVTWLMMSFMWDDGTLRKRGLVDWFSWHQNLRAVWAWSGLQVSPLSPSTGNLGSSQHRIELKQSPTYTWRLGLRTAQSRILLFCLILECSQLSERWKTDLSNQL